MWYEQRDQQQWDRMAADEDLKEKLGKNWLGLRKQVPRPWLMRLAHEAGTYGYNKGPRRLR